MHRSRGGGQHEQAPYPQKQSEYDLWPPNDPNNPVNNELWPPSPNPHIKNVSAWGELSRKKFIPTKLSRTESHKNGLVQSRVVQGCIVKDSLSRA